MAGSADRSETRKPPAGLVAEWGPLLVVVLAVWLAWRILLGPVVQRAPPELALRLASRSTTALSRAAESEYSAGRIRTARTAAAEALTGRPFDVRALRVFGLTEARAGRLKQADTILTLAGNWSLRDTVTHGWLVERRLRQGSYSSAFAHADTLARRRPSIQPSVFRLFFAAANADPRAIPPLVQLIAVSPPWRTPFIDSLYTSGDQAALQAALAVSLQDTQGPFTDRELRQLYIHWLEEGRLPGLKALRQRLDRPPAEMTLVDGSFDGMAGPEPFAWALSSSPGISLEMMTDDLNAKEQALRVDYDSYSNAMMAQQLLILGPGRHVFFGKTRQETATDEPRMAWSVSCLETGATVAVMKSPVVEPEQGWKSFSSSFEVPATGCSAQWLRLQGLPGERRRSVAQWFDHLGLRESPARAQGTALD